MPVEFTSAGHCRVVSCDCELFLSKRAYWGAGFELEAIEMTSMKLETWKLFLLFLRYLDSFCSVIPASL